MPPKIGRITIALADDHELVRDGIRTLLASDPSLEIVAEAGDGLEALEMVQHHHPDVLLLDLRMPRLHGIDVIRHVHGQSGTKVVVLSMHTEEPYLVEALRRGASGYLPKHCSLAELVQGIRAAAGGQDYVPEPLRQRAMSAALKTKGRAHVTNREQAVLELAAQGKTSVEIATALQISCRTAEAHRANLMKKLSLKTQTDLMLYALRQGLVSA